MVIARSSEYYVIPENAFQDGTTSHNFGTKMSRGTSSSISENFAESNDRNDSHATMEPLICIISPAEIDVVRAVLDAARCGTIFTGWVDTHPGVCISGLI